LRQEKRIDAKGRRYRAKHSVRTWIGGQQLSLWADIDTAPREFLEKSFGQRRQAIVGDCFQIKQDIDHFNDEHPGEQPIQIILDFTDDVAEMEAGQHQALDQVQAEEASMEFTPGDTVQLKSGGPIMTVEQDGEYWSIEGTAVWCVWFEKVGNKQVASRETFAAVALDKSERPAAFIGIDRHADPFIGDLTGAARDATALWAVLSDSIVDLDAPLITNDVATLAAMRDVLDATLGAADEDDVVILGFAGHGTQDHRLVLHDTSIAGLPNTTLGMDELAQRFRETRARAVILLLDCCFSGGAPARVIDAGLVPRDAVAFPLVEIAGQGRILFAASAADQEALEDPQSRHGLFTKAVIDVLLEADAPLGVLELVDRVTRLVTANAGRFGYIQSPTMFGQTEGDLVLPPGQIGARFRAAFPER
ncbi:hypothetical protein LTR94_026679, partial [Friedmanniomyces endolithicus]